MYTLSFFPGLISAFEKRVFFKIALSFSYCNYTLICAVLFLIFPKNSTLFGCNFCIVEIHRIGKKLKFPSKD